MKNDYIKRELNFHCPFCGKKLETLMNSECNFALYHSKNDNPDCIFAHDESTTLTDFIYKNVEELFSLSAKISEPTVEHIILCDKVEQHIKTKLEEIVENYVLLDSELVTLKQQFEIVMNNYTRGEKELFESIEKPKFKRFHALTYCNYLGYKHKGENLIIKLEEYFLDGEIQYLCIPIEYFSMSIEEIFNDVIKKVNSETELFFSKITPIVEQYKIDTQKKDQERKATQEVEDYKRYLELKEKFEKK